MTQKDVHGSLDLNGHIAILSLGSNCGDRIANVGNALDWINSVTGGCTASTIYETPEIHGIGNPYMNAVCRCITNHSLDAMTELTKLYEHQHGRDSECRKRGDVPIDIDIVIWDKEVVRPLDFSRSFFKIGYRMIESC